jgi:hypothetical protein
MSRGFSFVEMTVSTAIVLAVTAAMFALTDPAHGPFRALPELMDEQQRLRVAAETITRELLLAGAGTGGRIAAVMPFRRGELAPDPPGVFFGDRVSVLYVPAGAPQTVLDLPTDGGSAVYVREPGGFAANMLAMIVDESGSCDTFRIAAVQDQPPALITASGTLSRTYAAGAAVTRAISSTFWIRNEAGTGANQLMRYDGNLTDAPVADEIEGVSFTYYGVEEGGSPALVELEARRLTDGPWRPDAAAPNRFDADLLAVRRVRVTLRARRGRTIVFDVAPRNSGLPP